MRIDDFVNLPSSVRNVMYFMGGISMVGIAGIVFDRDVAKIVAIGLVAILLAVLCFMGIRALLRKRRANSLTSELTQHSSSAPSGVGDAAGRATLHALQQTFSAGIAKFGATENIYKFPWYLIVGEPGSGKTEAIRHCGVGFPPGMHEKGTEQLGVGGTINMNWWFTNNAVFLDTAGKLMFQDVAPGQTSEWKEFLQLLVRNRKNCPINGLMLVIPADALINDGDTGLDAKASKIAAQFELIQRTLDVRFPVFVVITKCDKLSGFREFFDGFQSAESVNQMLGWSNPEDRDVPFAPERVSEHLAKVVQRIKKRRLSILRDPIPQTESRRADEVDALFSLPRSIELIAPRLRQYLEKIFVAGPWAPKPLFLRGIYCTSSMCEGAALDQELALALGNGADTFKDLKVWKKERTYFLKDIFTEKVFREKGLVTRATNTRKMLRNRSLLLWGTATLLSLAFLGLTVFGYKKFSESIRKNSAIWVAAARTKAVDPEHPDWNNGVWKPLIKAGLFQGTNTKVDIAGESIDLLPYHAQLKAASKAEIETGGGFLVGELNEKRLKAQRIVFEGSAVFPIVQAARNRMMSEDIDNAIDKAESSSERLTREIDALKALLKIEIDQLPLSKITVEQLPRDVFFPLMKYTATYLPNDEQQKNFREVFLSTYHDNSEAKWVPERLSKGYTSLSGNKAIDSGIRRLKALAKRSVEEQMDATTQIRDVRKSLADFREIETKMASFDPSQKNIDYVKLRALFKELEGAKSAIDDSVKKGIASKALDIGKPSMLTSYKRLVEESKKASNGDFVSLREYIKPYLEKIPGVGIFKEIDVELDAYSKALSDDVDSKLTKDNPSELEELDGYLQERLEAATPQRIYVLRFAAYHDAFDAEKKNDKPVELVGKGWLLHSQVKEEFKTAMGRLARRELDLRPDSMKTVPKLSGPCTIMLNLAENERLGKIEASYLVETYKLFEENFGIPYVSNSTKPHNASGASSAIKLWKLDQGEGFAGVSLATKEKLNQLFGKFDAMIAASASDKAASDAVAANDVIRAKNQKALDAWKVEITVKQNNKWHTANTKDIFNTDAYIGEFSASATVAIKLNDPNNPPFDAVVDIGTKSESGSFGPSSWPVQIVLKRGPKPMELPLEPVPKRIAGPDKAEILRALSPK